MPENHTRFTDLLNGYANKSLTQVEENELFDLLNNVSAAEVEPMLTAMLEQTEPMPDAERRERLLGKILHLAQGDTSIAALLQMEKGASICRM